MGRRSGLRNFPPRYPSGSVSRPSNRPRRAAVARSPFCRSLSFLACSIAGGIQPALLLRHRARTPQDPALQRHSTPDRSGSRRGEVSLTAWSSRIIMGFHGCESNSDHRHPTVGRGHGGGGVALVRSRSDCPANVPPVDHSVQSCGSTGFARRASRFLYFPDRSAQPAIAFSLRHCDSRLRTALLDASS